MKFLVAAIILATAPVSLPGVAGIQSGLTWDDQALFDALDLHRADLLDVKAALERSDLAEAKKLLVLHFRSRAIPVAPGLPSPDNDDLRPADAICDHVFSFLGCPPARLDREIHWNEDPHDYIEWPVYLNRHNHWITLAQAYANTKDEKYAREFVEELNSWIAAVPVNIRDNRVDGPFLVPPRIPLSLSAGIRMAKTWWPSYNAFKDSPTFDTDSQFRMLRSMYDHARYLMNPEVFHVSSNWGTEEAAGLMTLGLMLPEFREAPIWVRTASERALAAQNAQVYPDGAQIELTPGYHRMSLENFLSILEMTRRNGVAMPAEFQARLEKMFECLVAVTMPDGRLPALNDSLWSAVGPTLELGFKLFPNRTDFQFLGSERISGAPPDKTSWALPYAGWFVMRTGWGPDDGYLIFEAGPFGAAHQHEDKLGIIIHAGGRTILPEGGRYFYDKSDWRRYVLSTRAHNTVMVDGLDQNRRSKRETWVDWKPEKSRWQTSADFDFAEGTYDSGYGPKNEVNVTHRRQVVFMKPDYWIVVDTMTPNDDLNHRYEAIFHLDAEEAVVDPATKTVTIGYGENAFRIRPLNGDGVDVEIVKGQKEPVVQGWLPKSEPNDLRPIPTAVYRWSARGPVARAFAVEPRRKDKTWSIASVLPSSSVPGIGATLDILQTEGGIDVLDFHAGTAREVVRKNPAGETRSVLKVP